MPSMAAVWIFEKVLVMCALLTQISAGILIVGEVSANEHDSGDALLLYPFIHIGVHLLALFTFVPAISTCTKKKEVTCNSF